MTEVDILHPTCKSIPSLVCGAGGSTPSAPQSFSLCSLREKFWTCSGSQSTLPAFFGDQRSVSSLSIQQPQCKRARKWGFPPWRLGVRSQRSVSFRKEQFEQISMGTKDNVTMCPPFVPLGRDNLPRAGGRGCFRFQTLSEERIRLLSLHMLSLHPEVPSLLTCHEESGCVNWNTVTSGIPQGGIGVGS